MFGNIEEICEISSKLLRSMELAAKSDFDNQLLGNVSTFLIYFISFDNNKNKSRKDKEEIYFFLYLSLDILQA